MVIVCAWCGTPLGRKEPLADARRSHGVCPECCERLTATRNGDAAAAEPPVSGGMVFSRLSSAPDHHTAGLAPVKPAGPAADRRGMRDEPPAPQALVIHPSPAERGAIRRAIAAAFRFETVAECATPRDGLDVSAADCELVVVADDYDAPALADLYNIWARIGSPEAALLLAVPADGRREPEGTVLEAGGYFFALVAPRRV